ncbi:MAG: carbon-nitrogen hydrolase family protein [Vulcanimicrobiaceae bacterium]
MSRRTIIVASLQLDAHERTAFAQVWPEIVARIREAARTGAQLVVLPEGTAPAYVMGYAPYDGDASRRALADIQSVAHEMRTTVIFGSTRQNGSRLLNSAHVVDSDGSLAGSADKQFLWHFDRQWFEPGDTLQPIRTSIGTVGVLVCADGRIPTIARTLVDRGAELLVMPTAWVTSGRDPNNLENAQADLLARIRARENGVPFAAANKVGVELGCVAYCGKSQIVGADGSMLALASQDRSETIFAEIELTGAREPRGAYAIGDFPVWPAVAQRIAITQHAYEDAQLAERLRIIEATTVILPGRRHATAQAPGDLPIVNACDEMMLDPAGLVPERSNGRTIAVWETELRDATWTTAYARARALELRMYVIVIAPSQDRAFAVDPDGAVVAGTFGTFDLASFAFDPARTENTLVAPGTDVLDGLARAARA